MIYIRNDGSGDGYIRNDTLEISEMMDPGTDMIDAKQWAALIGMPTFNLQLLLSLANLWNLWNIWNMGTFGI